MVCYENTIILIGGRSHNVHTAQVELFDLMREGGKWRVNISAPSLRKARWRHSSCVAGDRIYTFGGDSGVNYLTSLESINARKLVAGHPSAVWRRVKIDMEEDYGVVARSHPILSPIYDGAILIAGGFAANGNKLGDWRIVDLEDRSISSVDSMVI